jgi:PAS domain S-box-containing protein
MTLAVDIQRPSDTVQLAELPETLESLTRVLTADAIFVVDPEYCLAHWDAGSESLTGFLAEEMVGKPCYEALSGEGQDGTPFGIHVHSAVRLAWAGRPYPGYDARVFTRSGGERWIAVSSLAVETEEGPYVICLMRDAQEAHETLEMARDLIRLSRHERPTEGARVVSAETHQCSRRDSGRSSGCWRPARRPARSAASSSSHRRRSETTYARFSRRSGPTLSSRPWPELATRACWAPSSRPERRVLVSLARAS